MPPRPRAYPPGGPQPDNVDRIATGVRLLGGTTVHRANEAGRPACAGMVPGALPNAEWMRTTFPVDCPRPGCADA